MPVIGQGTFGCVHKPALKCSRKKITTDDDKISKLMTAEDAKKELKEYKLLEKNDKLTNHFLGMPETCKPSQSNANKTEISDCKKSNDFIDNLSSQKLLIMKDGGPDLDSTLKYISSQDAKQQKHLIHSLLNDFMQILKSVQYFTQHKLSHRDIKNGNIVYKDNNMKMIDFGLMREYKTIIKESKNNVYSLNDVWWSVSPISKFMNINKYSMINIDNASDISTLTIKRYMNNDNFLFTSHLLNLKPIIFNKFLASLHKLILDIPNHSHDKFLEKAIPCIDLYNIGLTLYILCVICQQEKINLDKSIINDITKLSSKLINCNVFNHLTIDDTIIKYEKILFRHKIRSNNIKTSPIDTNKVIQGYNSYTKVTNETFKQYAQFCDKEHVYFPLTGTCIKKCNSSQQRNPRTKRCNAKCKSHQKRNKTFKCISMKKADK